MARVPEVSGVADYVEPTGKYVIQREYLHKNLKPLPKMVKIRQKRKNAFIPSGLSFSFCSFW
jgi:hypothetical protein